MLAGRATAFCLATSFPTQTLRVSAIYFLQLRGITTKKLDSNSSKVNSSAFTHRKDKKGKASVNCTMQPKEINSSEIKYHVEMESLLDDPSRLEAMTVKELRTIMRSSGIPTKGSKHDLLLKLTSYLNSKKHGEGVTPSSLQLESKKSPSKQKTGVSSCEEVVSCSETIETNPKKRKAKSKLSDTGCFSHHSAGAITEENLSSKTEVQDVKKSRVTVKRSSKNENGSPEAAITEPWTVLTHKKPQPGWIPYNPKTMRPPPLSDDTKSVKLMSWNVNGLRALLKSQGISLLQERENFDVLCLQETKMQEKDVHTIKKSLLDGYDNSFWTCSISKLGYSGTAIISRIKPISVTYGLGILDHDSEGRLVTVEFDKFYLLSGYVPNSGDGLKRLPYRINEWDISLSTYMKGLEKLKPVILTGDLNCAHEEIDIHNPAGNHRSAGFTDEERESFQKNFLARGFVDTFRRQHPSVVGYTYYGYRHGGRKTNKGWRLDYFLVSESIADKVHDSYIVPDISGSDHCPIGLILKL